MGRKQVPEQHSNTTESIELIPSPNDFTSDKILVGIQKSICPKARKNENWFSEALKASRGISKQRESSRNAQSFIFSKFQPKRKHWRPDFHRNPKSWATDTQMFWDLLRFYSMPSAFNLKTLSFTDGQEFQRQEHKKRPNLSKNRKEQHQ